MLGLQDQEEKEGPRFLLDQKEKEDEMKYAEEYRKYPHIIPGSIESTERGKIITVGKNDTLKSHGLICVIKCATHGAVPGCRETRLINIQDARQVKQCKFCIKYMKNLRRREKRQQY